MKGLNDVQRRVVDLCVSRPPDSCGGEQAVAEDWSDAEARAVDELVEQGRMTLVSCRCGCRHPLVTPDGLLALRLDEASKKGV